MQETHPAFSQVDHRPWPLPEQKWSWKQQWRDLLFLHWPVSVASIRDSIPAELEIDTYGGDAWIAVVPFDMKGVTKRGFPAPGFMCDFPEINVRTYVKYGDKPGVWFYSLDITNPLAVWVANTFFNIPYRTAKMNVTNKGVQVNYDHSRGDLRFRANYRPIEKATFEQDSFEIWATERYCLYTQNKSGKVLRGEVQHPQWPLQTAEIDIFENTLMDPFEAGPMHPSILFSRAIDVVVYPPYRIN